MIDAQALIGRRFQESWSDDLLISSASRLTYGDVWNAARYYASTWAASGVHPGDSVALVLSNDVSFPCLYLACVIGGFIAGALGISWGGWIGSTIVATIGAVILLFLLGLVKRRA